jgi:hypothetical protein
MDDDLRTNEVNEEADYDINKADYPESWGELVDEEIEGIDTEYLDTEDFDEAGYGDLLEALGYIDEIVEGDEIDVEIDENTTDQLRWGSLEGPVVLNLEMEASEILDDIEESRITYKGKFIEVDHNPPIILGFGVYEDDNSHQSEFKTENLYISAPDKDFYQDFR